MSMLFMNKEISNVDNVIMLSKLHATGSFVQNYIEVRNGTDVTFLESKAFGLIARSAVGDCFWRHICAPVDRTGGSPTNQLMHLIIVH